MSKLIASSLMTDAQLAAVTAPLAAAKTLPPVAYTSDEIFDDEKSQVFYSEWICVAREEQVAEPGQYLLAEVVDQPVIVVRQNDGTIKALSAICPHRGMPIIAEPGQGMQFQCPYHLWKFGLSGQLISAPHMDGVADFPDASCNLRDVALDTWAGFIFVNIDGTAAPLAERLGPLDAIVGEYDMADMVTSATLDFDSPWNWKILIENFMEAYHHIGPHRISVQPNYHAKDSYVSGSVEEGWSVLHMPRSPNADEASPMPPLPGLSAERENEILATLVMPTLAILNTPALAFWYQLLPRGAGQMDLKIHTLLPKALAIPEVAEGAEASIRDIHLEDIMANEGPFRGMQAPLTEQGRLSQLEAAIWQLNQWWVERMTAA